MRDSLSSRQLVTGTLLLLLLGMSVPWAVAQGEPSPIVVDLVVPPEAGPGTAYEILIKYDATDLNAGADINYNVEGPCQIVTRDPEPANPAYNTWAPTRDTAKGTIKVNLQAHEGSVGQVCKHLVEVRWGPKVQKHRAETQIKEIPPTPTPRPTPRPGPQATASPSPTPTETPAEAVLPTIQIESVDLVDLSGEPISTAMSNQEIALKVLYASSGDLANVRAIIGFEPDVVNLEGLQVADDGYVAELPFLPAAPEGALLIDPPLKGRIRPHEGGGASYELRVVVWIQPAEGMTENLPGELGSPPVTVYQITPVVVRAEAELDVVKAEGSLIVHIRGENAGPVPVEGVRLYLAGLPEGFSVHPHEQVIDRIAENGGSVERVFTVRVPEAYSGQTTFVAVAVVGEAVIESEPIRANVVASVPLRIEVLGDDHTIHAGEEIRVIVRLKNDGDFPAEDVTARLIDTSGNLGVLVQDVGHIPAGESKETTFVVEIPHDFPADVTSTLVVQTVSGDGTVSESELISTSILCVPAYEVVAQPLAGRLEGGQSAEAIVVVRNASQCTGHDVTVSIVGLPTAFVTPSARKIVELAPGTMRHLTFNLLIPHGYEGEGTFLAEVADSVGSRAKSDSAEFSVSGVPVAFTITFGLLALVAVAAIVIGVVFYFRYR